jgi:glycosyltransferase involved in cell wall biosynthesis
MPVKISVIIPTKNRAELIRRSLKSVFEQDLRPYEVIVIDDGSTDNTSMTIKRDFPDVKILRNLESKGGAVARNQGAELATGEYLAFLDSDDEWLPGHLKNKISLIEETSADSAFGNFILAKGNQETEIIFKADYSTKGNIGNSILSAQRFDARTSTFVFKREAFLEVKFDENLKKHQDWDLAINFDNNFKWCKDDIPSVRILVEQGEERMSHKLQHNSSFYFLDKNSKFLDSNNIFMFCMKQIMRSQLAHEPKSIINKYLSVAGSHYNNLMFQNKLFFLMVKYRFLNLGTIYKLLNKFRS